MRNNHGNIRKKLLPGVIPLAILMLILLVPTVVQAATYYAWGRVYSAAVIPEGEEDAPPNPLSGVAPEQIIGDNLYALDIRNLVKVKVVAASTGVELGSGVVTYDGGYLVSFTTPTTPTIDAKFIIEELATSKILMESKQVTLSEWSAGSTANIFYLLVQESLTDIGGDREFAKNPKPGKYTAIFTRIGKIELETEVAGSTYRLIDKVKGDVNVPNTVATDLAIHEYQDAPFGGNLYMFGAFSQKLYTSGVHYYRVKIEKYNDAFTTVISSEYMSDPLVKTKYTVNLSTLTVNTDRITLGPQTVGADDNCYQLTPLASGSGSIQEFWSFPDLLALWRTGSRSGNYLVKIELIGPLAPHFKAVENFTNLRLKLDNVSLEAQILPFVTPPSPAGSTPDSIWEFDSPYLYTPGPAVTSYDLLNSPLGAEGNYGPGVDPRCAILDFAHPSDHLAFKLTAYHGSGYMRYWIFSFKRNNTGYSKIIGKYYNKSVSTTELQDYTGLKITSCSQNGTRGFKDKYLYLNPTHVDLGVSDGCGYRFVIEAGTRTTDGYGYLHYAQDEDIHYLKR